MSFKKYISELNDLNQFTKEQKLVLIAGKVFENQNFTLKTNNANEDPFIDFKTKENKFSFDFKKDDDIYNLNIQNKKDGNFEISISNDRRSTSEEIKLDNYLKNNSKDYSDLEIYIKDRIKNLENDPLFQGERELRIPPPKLNNNINPNNNIHKINLREVNNIADNDYLRPNNEDNYYLNQNIEIGGGFGNIGYSDLHGDLPNFVPGYNNSFGRPKGNLMGPEDFGFRGPGLGGIRYDPITPFGPKFDFTPQYDGPMKKPGNLGGNIDLGMPGGNGFRFGNNFGGSGGGFNPFI